MRKLLIGSALAVGLVSSAAYVAYNHVVVFVIHPMIREPEGSTLIMWRNSAPLNFVDNAEALCDRALGGRSLLCRSVAISATVRDNPTLLTLPFSKTLYDAAS